MASDFVFYNLLIYIPFFNRASGVIDYTTVTTYSTTTNGGTTSDVQEIIARYAWFNKLNPDWKSQSVNFDYVYNFLQPGEQTIPAPLGVNSVVFTLNAEPGALDYWWGTKKIAKFAAFGFTFQNNILGPLNFINADKSEWSNDAGAPTDGVYINLQPGVSGVAVFATPGGSNPTLTDIPPVQYVTTDPVALLWAPNYTGDPLQPGAQFGVPVTPGSGLSPSYVP